MKDVLMNIENKTPVLIIAPFFAPQTHAAMFRVHKLVKYLPQYGYKPIIITTDINYNYNEDLSLLEEFDECVEIHRVKYIEPTIRGLRMAFGGKDRTFKAMKHIHVQNNSSLSNCNENKTKKNNILKDFKNSIQNMLLNIPDAYWTWTNNAVKKATELIKKNNIKIFYTTTNPDSVLKIGLNIKNNYPTIKWVSDFRDPIGYSERYNTHHKIVDKSIKKLKKEAMIKSDMVTGLSSSYGIIFKELYNLEEEKFVFIPTGVDDLYLEDLNVTKSDEKYIIFIGEFQDKYNDYIFKVFSNVLKKYDTKFKIKFIGRKEVNYPKIIKILKKHNLENISEFLDHMPQTELYKKIKNAHSTILLTGGDNFWWCNFAKMVDYIALNKYIISDVSENSEAKKEISKTDKGVFLSGNISKDTDIVYNHLQTELNDEIFNEYYKNYLASSQVKSFINIFDKLIGKTND